MRAERQRVRIIQASNVRVPGRVPWWMMPSVKATLIVTDITIAISSFVAAFALRDGSTILLRISGGSYSWSQGFAPYATLLPFVILIRPLTLSYYDLYRLRGEFSFLDDGIRVFKATAIASLLITAAAFLYRGGFQYRAFSYARSIFVLDFILAFVSTETARLIMRRAQTLLRDHGINLIPTLVVGRGAEASLCINEMRERPSLGYRVIGFVESGSVDGKGLETYEGVPVISDLRGLLIRLFREPLSNSARVLKRISDLVIAAATMALFFPLWLVIAALIKLDSKGPILYTQERVGMDGRIFLVYKFRTMHVGVDHKPHWDYQQKFIAGRAEANLGDIERPAYKLQNDPRITRIGRVLRRLSLDEIPQLLNVLLGDMSIVGPRPPIPYEVEAYELWHRKRLDMKPGLTGLWQVSGRNRLPFEEMVKLDLFYIENWSLLLDLKIILRTTLAVFHGDGY